MAPRRTRTNRKVDHCTYVQRLFQDFLSRNRPEAATIPEVRAKPIQPPLQHFYVDGTDTGESLYMQTVRRNLRRAQGIPEPPNSVKKFFEKSIPREIPLNNRDRSNHPVYARFKRRDGTNQFLKREPSPSAPPGGLMLWLEKVKLAQARNKAVAKRKDDEYINLPSDFFSGRESMKLPFEVNCDKTLVSVGSIFVPPAASTPFEERLFPCSPIVTDPDELIQETKELRPTIKYEEFLRKISSVMENINAATCRVLKRAIEDTPLDQNYHELKRMLVKHRVVQQESLPASFAERDSWRDHSLISNKAHYQCRKRGPSPSLFSNTNQEFSAVDCDDTNSTMNEVQLGRHSLRPATLHSTMDSFQEEIFGPTGTAKKMRSNWLLTASPPSPPNIGLRSPKEALPVGLTSHQNDETFDFDFSQPDAELGFSATHSFSFPTQKSTGSPHLDLSDFLTQKSESTNYFTQETIASDFTFLTQKTATNDNFDFLSPTNNQVFSFEEFFRTPRPLLDTKQNESTSFLDFTF
ncbi:uncharacterized protein LOC131695563 [Topomyia yanbarensis]|uniref:uncharacterized protein LOC131695563 n=1 Tax=Topomyia yanbarensis TaxID=2498891 RepID=UPI00273B99AC|nr:uncharacterized protein LOC131695563 [Topomyia yanbarensis]